MATKDRFILVLVVIAVIVFSLTPICKSQNSQNSDQLYVNTNVYISDVNLQNHTITADIDLQIDGIKNLTIGGIPQTPSNITVILDDIAKDNVVLKVNSDYGNGTYSASGKILSTNWYLTTEGKAIPLTVTFSFLVHSQTT